MRVFFSYSSDDLSFISRTVACLYDAGDVSDMSRNI